MTCCSPHKLCPPIITRRQMLRQAGFGFGAWALLDLLMRDGAFASDAGSAANPLAAKPAHFVRFVGRRARVRTRHSHPLPRAGERGGTLDVTSFTGELVGATDSEVTLAANGGVIAIPYSDIRRSNLLED